MSRIAYVNGRYVPHAEAAVHVEDRGYQFADGVYEVAAVFGGHLVDDGWHLDRLDRSLREMRLKPPVTRRALSVVMREIVRRNRVRDGLIYIQITRGVAPRDHGFPAHADSALVVTARHNKPFDLAAAGKGIKVITIPDIRWKRRDIKTISLLPNCLGKQQAREAGAYEAWQVEADGYVTEGTSTNAWIVTPAGEMVTRRADENILSGVTRRALIMLAEHAGIRFVERPFTVAEAIAAREAFLTSATSFVKPIVQIDDSMIGDGKPGPIARRLLEIYAAHMAGRDAAA